MLSKTVHLKADLLHRENSSEIELNGGGGRRDIREQMTPNLFHFYLTENVLSAINQLFLTSLRGGQEKGES